MRWRNTEGKVDPNKINLGYTEGGWFIIQRVSQRTWIALRLGIKSEDNVIGNSKVMQEFFKDGTILQYSNPISCRKDIMSIMLTGRPMLNVADDPVLPNTERWEML